MPRPEEKNEKKKNFSTRLINLQSVNMPFTVCTTSFLALIYNTFMTITNFWSMSSEGDHLAASPGAAPGPKLPAEEPDVIIGLWSICACHEFQPPFNERVYPRRTTPHNTTQHHTTSHNTTQHHTTPHNHHTTPHNATQYFFRPKNIFFKNDQKWPKLVKNGQK